MTRTLGCSVAGSDTIIYRTEVVGWDANKPTYVRAYVDFAVKFVF